MNIGSEEMVTINQLAPLVMDIAGKKLTVKPYSRTAGRPRAQLR